MVYASISKFLIYLIPNCGSLGLDVTIWECNVQPGAIVLLCVSVALITTAGGVAIFQLVKEFAKHRAEARPWGELPFHKHFLVVFVYEREAHYYALIQQIDRDGFLKGEPLFYRFSQLIRGGSREVITRNGDIIESKSLQLFLSSSGEVIEGIPPHES